MAYKSYFDIPEEIVYLNTLGNGLMPWAHHQWRKRWDGTFFDLRSDLRDQQWDLMKEVKTELDGLPKGFK